MSPNPFLKMEVWFLLNDLPFIPNHYLDGSLCLKIKIKSSTI